MNFIQNLDSSIHGGIQSLRTSGLDVVLEGLTHLGDSLFLSIIVLAACVVLFRLGRLPSAGLLVLAALLGMVLVEVTKELVRRPRPDFVPLFWDGSRPSFSYPSGHAFNSASVYLTTALIVGRSFSTRVRRRLIVGALALTGLVGLTRPYLGVHYLTDVLGGWAGGVGWSLLWVWLDQRLAPPRLRRSSTK